MEAAMFCRRKPLDQRFANEQEAAFALLCDVAGHLSAANVRFVIVGGWVTKLFHSVRFEHPGTFDVDVLLDDVSLVDGSFDRAAAAMLNAGYVRAVKNKFQAHRLLRVGRERFLFHTDFLNRLSPPEAGRLVVGTGPLFSIYTPAMALVQKCGNFRYASDRRLAGVRFPCTDAFIATKAVGMGVPKRERDAFDVFVTLVDEEPRTVGQRWSTFSDGGFKEALDLIGRAVASGDAVQKTMRWGPRGQTEETIRSTFEAFLQAAGYSATPSNAERASQ